MLGDKRAYNTKQPAPETSNTTSGASDWCWERFGRPAIQNSIEHGLEEILHDVKADVGRCTIDGAEEEDADTHHRGGDDHCPLSSYSRNTIGRCTEEDADDAWEINIDVRTVRIAEGEIERSILDSKDFGEEGA